MKFHEWSDANVEVSEKDGNAKGIHGLIGWWKRDVRPYYKSWPSITKVLSSFTLDVPVASIVSDRVFLVRFADGHEPAYQLKHPGVLLDRPLVAKITSVLTGCVVHSHDKSGMVFAFQAVFDDELKTLGVVGTGTTENKDRTIESWLLDGKSKSSARNQDTIDGLGAMWIWGPLEMACRIAVACHMLANDPSIITPDVLSKDRDRYDRETDEAWKERAVERARRRGVVGWNIGADYEVCPHYRRPHFGIRYTGKGGTVPRIVPIKGAVVHRSKLTEVPTGYILPDGREVEP